MRGIVLGSSLQPGHQPMAVGTSAMVLDLVLALVPAPRRTRGTTPSHLAVQAPGGTDAFVLALCHLRSLLRHIQRHLLRHLRQVQHRRVADGEVSPMLSHASCEALSLVALTRPCC